jgi:hypothetical protein
MQACPDQQDFRAQQCAAFNDVPYDGAMFVWTPHYDDAEPCALLCRQVELYSYHTYKWMCIEVEAEQFRLFNF